MIRSERRRQISTPVHTLYSHESSLWSCLTVYCECMSLFNAFSTSLKWLIQVQFRYKLLPVQSHSLMPFLWHCVMLCQLFLKNRKLLFLLTWQSYSKSNWSINVEDVQVHKSIYYSNTFSFNYFWEELLSYADDFKQLTSSSWANLAVLIPLNWMIDEMWKKKLTLSKPVRWNNPTFPSKVQWFDRNVSSEVGTYM